MYNNKCDKCGQAATHKFTRIEKGQIFDLFLCAQHAAEHSPYQKQQHNLSEILEGLLKSDLKIKVTTSGMSTPSGVRCSSCGLAFEHYRRNFILGCSECYGSFHDLLVHDLRKFHGGVRHVGRRPGGGRIELPADEMACAAPEEAEAVEPTAGSVLSQQKQLAIVKDLQRKMERAIQSEDFEKAARYRDQINELKQRLQT